MSLSKNFLQVLIITTPGRKKLTVSLKQIFLYFSSFKREEDYGVEKMTKIKQGYWLQVLINSTFFATIAFLVSVLLYDNLVSSMLNCEGPLT